MVNASETLGPPPVLCASRMTSIGFAFHHSPVHPSPSRISLVRLDHVMQDNISKKEKEDRAEVGVADRG